MTITQLTIKQMAAKESEMQRAFYKSFCNRYELVANNLYLDWCGCEMDLFGLRKSGFIDEIEIKRSVSDFNADFKKTTRVSCEPYMPNNVFNPCINKWCSRCHGTRIMEETGNPCGFWTRYSQRSTREMQKHEAIKSGKHSCNYFSFYLPADIVDKCEIPDYAGLYVLAPDNYHCISEVKKAPRLHSRKISDANKYKTAKKMHYRYWDYITGVSKL